MSNIKERFYRKREDLFESLADHCQQRLEQACVKNGQASFMVSGGSTPAPLYKKLARRVMSWPKIDVALVDERWVDENHDSSNAAFIQKTLLTHNAAKVRFTGLKTAESCVHKGVTQAVDQYQSLPAPWDLTLLGMGTDGHTASIFPEAEGTEQALCAKQDKLLAAIKAKPSKVTGNNLERITLSRFGLLKSKEIVLLITGEEKLDVYRRALTQKDPQKMPVSAVLQQTQVPLQVFWAP